MNDFEWPLRETFGGGAKKDQVPPDRSSGAGREANQFESEDQGQRTQIVWLPNDDSALDAFASESDLADAPAPSPAAATRQAATALPPITYAPDSIQDRTTEPIGAPAIEPIPDSPIDPIADYQIDSDRNVAIGPILESGRRGSTGTPATRLLRRCAIFVVLVLGVFGGGTAGLYLRRNPIDLAIIRIPVNEAAIQPTLAPPPPTASPANDDAGTTSVDDRPGTSAGGPAGLPSNQPPPVSPPPDPRTILNGTAAPSRPETPVPAPPRAATENPSPQPVVVPPAPTPPTRIDPLTTAGGAASTREPTDANDVRPPSQAIPIAPGATVGAPVEASVAPPAAPDAVPPATGTSSTTDRVRVTDATPGVAEVADEQRIAAVLKRFTDAYAQLSAPAAKAVWPTVDGRALSRAFDALESQSIEFDDCTVHFAGAEARAACVGNLTYVPKIGRRSARTVNRHWNFVMKRSPEGWMIADAQMR